MDRISIVIPCYNEESMVPLLYQELERVRKSMQGVQMEYLFVDDGSKDDTIGQIESLCKVDKKVGYVALSRNFGKEAAIYAGLEHATGDYVALIDADLQDPPSLLPEMYRILKEEEYDSVATRRVTRKGEPPIRSFFARQFYRLMNKISDVELMDGARDFRLMKRKYVDAVLMLKEYNRFTKGLFGWVGFKTKWIEFENVERAAGETKWSFWKLVKYSIEGIASFSEVPLYMSSVLGMLMCVFAFFAIVFIVIRQIFFGGSAFGWPSMACIVILIGGLQLLSIGVLGLYFSKAYLEVKNRPIYIARDKCVAEWNESEECEGKEK